MTDWGQPPLGATVLTVKVGDETFGLPIARVRTIFRVGTVTRVPLGPPTLLGLINLRGAIVPALSLRRRLHIEGEGPRSGSLAIGLDEGPECFALVVDDVGDVIDLEAPDAIALPPHMVEARAAVTEAVYRLEDGVLPILNLSALVPHPSDRSESPDVDTSPGRNSFSGAV